MTQLLMKRVNHECGRCATCLDAKAAEEKAGYKNPNWK